MSFDFHARVGVGLKVRGLSFRYSKPGEDFLQFFRPLRGSALRSAWLGYDLGLGGGFAIRNGDGLPKRVCYGIELGFVDVAAIWYVLGLGWLVREVFWDSGFRFWNWFM